MKNTFNFWKNTFNFWKILEKKIKKYVHFSVLVEIWNKDTFNLNFTYSKYLDLLQNLEQYCSPRASPSGCNTAPRSAINPRILNAWNSNYKYLYIVLLFIFHVSWVVWKYSNNATYNWFLVGFGLGEHTIKLYSIF